MILYLDTSALVKLYVAEEDSERVQAAVFSADELWTSVVAYAEARAALARRRREGRLSELGHEVVIKAVHDVQRAFLYAARSGQGEAEAVVLAQELGAHVLVDDAKGRRLAEAEGVASFGTLAVLVALHHAGAVVELEETLDRLGRLGFYMSPALRQRVLIGSVR